MRQVSHSPMAPGKCARVLLLLYSLEMNTIYCRKLRKVVRNCGCCMTWLGTQRSLPVLIHSRKIDLLRHAFKTESLIKLGADSGRMRWLGWGGGVGGGIRVCYFWTVHNISPNCRSFLQFIGEGSHRSGILP